MLRKIVNFFLIPLFTIIAIFSFLLYLQNGTTIKIKMNNSLDREQNAQIYYKYGNEPFNEKHSMHAYKYENGVYYFKAPNYKKIKKLRIDPASRALDIDISKIEVVDKKWFKEKAFLLPLKLLKPANQVELKESKEGLVSFSTTGRDPQFKADFILNEKYSRSNIYIDKLAISIIAFLLILFIVNTYKMYEYSEHINAKLILYALFLAFTIFKVNYYVQNIHYGFPPDEPQHFRYIEYVHNHHNVIPKFEDMNSYLTHPSFYYEIMNLAFDEQVPERENVNNFRILTMYIFIIVYMLILYLGYRSKISIVSHFVYLTLVTSIPMHAYIGASISNDNLAALGAIIFIYGFKRVLEQKYTFATYLLLGLGAFLSYFAKLTAALLLFFVVVYFILYMFKTKKFIKINRYQIATLILFILPILYYQVMILKNYHGIIPTYNLTHPKEFLKSVFYVPPNLRMHLNLEEWLYRLIHYIKGGWFNIHSHHSFGQSSVYGYLGLLILHIFALVALLFKCDKENRVYCLVGKFTILALFSVLTVQFFFSYRAHLVNGYLGGLQPRYELPFMFAFAIMASLFVERFKKNFLAVVLIVAVSIHALYSDFFYFLQYYK